MKVNKKKKVLVTSPRSRSKKLSRVPKVTSQHKTIVLSGSSDDGDDVHDDSDSQGVSRIQRRQLSYNP